MKLTRTSKLFKAKLAGLNTKEELEIFGRIWLLSQQWNTQTWTNMILLSEPTGRLLRTSVYVFFRFRVVLEQGLNTTSTCIRNAKISRTI